MKYAITYSRPSDINGNPFRMREIYNEAGIHIETWEARSSRPNWDSVKGARLADRHPDCVELTEVDLTAGAYNKRKAINQRKPEGLCPFFHAD